MALISREGWAWYNDTQGGVVYTCEALCKKKTPTTNQFLFVVCSDVQSQIVVCHWEGISVCHIMTWGMVSVVCFEKLLFGKYMMCGTGYIYLTKCHCHALCIYPA